MSEKIIAPEEWAFVEVLCECGEEDFIKMNIFDEKYSDFEFGLESDGNGDDVPNWQCPECKHEMLESNDLCQECETIFDDEHPKSHISPLYCRECVCLGKV